MSSRMCRGNKISLTLFGASSPDYHPCRCYIPSFVEISPPVLEKKIFEGFLPYMGMVVILVM